MMTLMIMMIIIILINDNKTNNCNKKVTTICEMTADGLAAKQPGAREPKGGAG